MSRRVALSTSDNPFNPFENFHDWFAFDEVNGYHSCAYLARLFNSYNEMSEQTYIDEMEKAIDSIVDLNLTGNYIKVVKEVPDETTNDTASVNNVMEGGLLD